ncbi:hypothetical protein [Bacillus cereus group sp. BfR-BA-01328]|uniref:hypothetical protein n=1 Tax=Bacillus cereus group sp. BfR-BA-01328 TaxID=2920304 RepID=UPI001F5A1C02
MLSMKYFLVRNDIEQGAFNPSDVPATFKKYPKVSEEIIIENNAIDVINKLLSQTKNRIELTMNDKIDEQIIICEESKGNRNEYI